jgi:hypothetical protein
MRRTIRIAGIFFKLKDKMEILDGHKKNLEVNYKNGGTSFPW